MTEKKRAFDLDGFFQAIDATRITRKITWKKVSNETSVSASTLTRMAQGKSPDAASLASLAAWACINPADYVSSPQKAENSEPLAKVLAYLRADKNLPREGATALEELIKATYSRLAKDGSTKRI